MAINPVRRGVEYISVTISSGASLSSEIDMNGRILVGVIMPASWTTANLTFQVADVSGGTFNDFYDESGTEKAVTAAASRYIGLDSTDWFGAAFLKVRSGTTGTPVNQGADRTIKLAVFAPIHMA